MNESVKFVEYLYSRFEGRAPFCVGYVTNRAEKVYPFVFEDECPIGLIGLAALEGQEESEVQLFHISSFKNRNGHGTTMMNFLCREADRFSVTISLQAEMQFSKRDTPIESDLVQWYRKFGFEGNRFMRRKPHSNQSVLTTSASTRRLSLALAVNIDEPQITQKTQI